MYVFLKKDEMADLLVSTSGPKRTFGGSFVNGLFKMITVGNPPEIYVFDISMAAYKQGINYFADAVITIKDTNGSGVPNATVNVTWSGVVSGTDAGITGPGGTVSFRSPAAKKKAGPFTITVNNVTLATMNYNPLLNNETSDSVTY